MILSAAQTFPAQTARGEAISSAFEDQFAQEILKSDKLRVTILIGAVSSFCVALLVLALFAFDQFQQTFHGRFPRFLLTFLTFFSITLVCLLIERRLIFRRVQVRGNASALLQYLSAFVETSIPSIVLIVGVGFLGPVYTLFTPAPFVYPLFIVLSALRLNARLCVFTGAVAGIEYGLLSM